MLEKFVPTQYVPSIYEIKLDELMKRGIKGLMIDLDNTLIEWNRAHATENVMKWFEKVAEKGLLVKIISNNNEERVQTFAQPLNLPFIANAKKPLRRSFQRAMTAMGLKPSEVAVIGDQLLTDILGGNRLQLHTVLVSPVAQSDGFWTKFNRRIERAILARMKRKGIAFWEDNNG